MPLEVVSVVDQRLQIVLAPERLDVSVAEACRRFGISRETFYVYRRRFEADGVHGLLDRSRRPRRSPGRLPKAVEARICQLRAANPAWGAKRLRAELTRRYPNMLVPAVSTLHRVLDRNGLLVGEPRRGGRRLVAPVRFERSRPNALWQIDAMECVLAAGTTVFVIDALDDHSRYLVHALACDVADSVHAWACVAAAIDRCGVPQQLLSDNGRAFTGRIYGMVTEFERRLWRHGVQTIATSPRHPQTNGKIERQHSTLRSWLRDQPAATTLAELQTLLDRYRHHYNEERPHQALGDATPGERYRATTPAKPTGARPAQVTRKASHEGTISYSGRRIQLGRRWAGAIVDVIEHHDKVRVLYGDDLILTVPIETIDRYTGKHLQLA